MISGLVTAEVTGADIPGTLAKMTDSGLTLLWTVPVEELTVRVTLLRRDYRRFRQSCEKQGAKVTLISRRGAYWKLKGLLARQVMMLGVLMMIAATLYLPSRVLFVQVEGNRDVPARRILDMADKCGIGFGASRRAVRSERMKNALMEAVPELQWAGVNTKGCVAVITVRERAEEGMEDQPSEPGHIVALTDAVVTSCTATRGTLLCSPGQAVSEGQILISGYTDTGLVIRAEQASGEIFGQTRRSFRVITPVVSASVSKTGAELKKISLLLGKKRINLWKDSGISEVTCDRMYEEYYITLPGGFQLPMGLAVETFLVSELTQKEIPPPESESLLRGYAESYLLREMISGTIRFSEISYSQETGVLTLTGEYRCTELIGAMQRLQIGESNE